MKKIILFFILAISFFSNALFANNSKSLNLSFSDSIKGYDKITFGKIEPDSGNLLVGVHVDSNANTISLMLSSVNGNREKVYTLSKEKTSIAENVSTLKNGIYVVSLCVDGKVVDSVQLIKK